MLPPVVQVLLDQVDDKPEKSRVELCHGLLPRQDQDELGQWWVGKDLYEMLSHYLVHRGVKAHIVLEKLQNVVPNQSLIAGQAFVIVGIVDRINHIQGSVQDILHQIRLEVVPRAHQ